ncbi:MAG: hypothetical protein LLG04_15610 [Parachlamydia sp.]|nr:hypothetical protein [Parachlamydia sp.]
MDINLTDSQLIELNRQGLIPGPDETEEAFLKRTQYCLSLKTEIAEKLQLPFSDQEASSEEFVQPALAVTRKSYDIAPGWIPLFFSNHKLFPWHGGCVWIFQQSEESPTAAFLQLRRAFLNSETYLGLYSRNELIAHELCHVGRMCFEEPRFEEILAYRTSPSRLRGWLGAIAQSSCESMAFFLLLCLILAVDLYALAFDVPLESLAWLKLLPIGMFGAGLLRLIMRNQQFDQCLANLQKLLKDSQKASAVIYRLTDREIISFSHMAPDCFQDAIEERKGSSLRWRCIDKAYLEGR